MPSPSLSSSTHVHTSDIDRTVSGSFLRPKSRTEGGVLVPLTPRFCFFRVLFYLPSHLSIPIEKHPVYSLFPPFSTDSGRTWVEGATKSASVRANHEHAMRRTMVASVARARPNGVACFSAMAKVRPIVRKKRRKTRPYEAWRRRTVPSATNLEEKNKPRWRGARKRRLRNRTKRRAVGRKEGRNGTKNHVNEKLEWSGRNRKMGSRRLAELPDEPTKEKETDRVNGSTDV